MRVNGPKLDSFSVWSILCGNLVGPFFVLPLFLQNILNGGLLMLLAVNRLLVACNAVARANRVICLFVLNSNTSSIVVVSMVGL